MNIAFEDKQYAEQFIEAIDLDTFELCLVEKAENSLGWDLTNHSHACYEMVYFVNSIANIKTKDKTIHSTLYDVVIYPPGVLHQEFLNMNYSQKSIYIQFNAKSKVNFDKLIKIRDNNGAIFWLLEQIYLLRDKTGATRDELLKTYLKAVFFNVSMLNKYDEGDNSTLKTCLNYIMQQYYEDIDMEKLVSLVYVSPSYLTRLFNKNVGLSPMRYLNQVRIEISKRMLCATTASISEICEKVGFSDSKYFCRVFKQITNLTPSQFRMQNKNKFYE